MLSSIHGEETTTAITTNASVSLKQLLSWIVDRYPTMKACLQTAVIAINMEYADSNDNSIVISTGDEIAIIPPVSGG